MADHWPFVAAAYALAALVLGAYWRRLVRLDRPAARRRPSPGAPRPT